MLMSTIPHSSTVIDIDNCSYVYHFSAPHITLHESDCHHTIHTMAYKQEVTKPSLNLNYTYLY